MNMFIPSIGDQFTVTAPWDVSLFHGVNPTFFDFLVEQNPDAFDAKLKERESRWNMEWQYELMPDGRADMTKPKFTLITIPSGVVLQLAGLNIKTNARSPKGPTSFGSGVMFKIVSGLDGTKKKLDLWVRLDDVNKLKCEYIIPDVRASIKRLKKPDIVKAITELFSAMPYGGKTLTFDQRRPRPSWLTQDIERQFNALIVTFPNWIDPIMKAKFENDQKARLLQIAIDMKTGNIQMPYGLRGERPKTIDDYRRMAPQVFSFERTTFQPHVFTVSTMATLLSGEATFVRMANNVVRRTFSGPKEHWNFPGTDISSFKLIVDTDDDVKITNVFVEFGS